MTGGIHHITLITRKVQPNVDFYAGFLGLRLVKRTAGFEDAEQLHLFYGDADGNPGSLVTFLVWQDGAPGRVGHGQPSEIAFAIAPESIGFWLTRALQHNISIEAPVQEFAEPVLRLKDPDGVIVKLVGTNALPVGAAWNAPGIPANDAIRRLRGATILTERPQETGHFLERHFSYASAGRTDAIHRLVSPAGDIIDVRNATGFWTAAPGTGTIDHIAFRANDRDAVENARRRLAADGAGETNIHDRKYFYSLYVREPGGTLFELATDAPGMLVDEPPETLGTDLFIPDHFASDPAAARLLLPQFALPGEERMTERDLPFVHRFHHPDEPDGTTLVLLHGTGGNETSLLPVGSQIRPNATLLSLRGRSTDEGFPRWFRRLTAVTFDQKDIAGEAEALAAFIKGAESGYGIDLEKTAFLGYSNGANMLGAVMLLHPGLIRHAILLRAMNVLEQIPAANLEGTKVLMTTGAQDPYGPYAPALEKSLAAAGADVNNTLLNAGHELNMDDIGTAKTWLADNGL